MTSRAASTDLQRPSDCRDEDLEGFYRLVESGGEVGLQYLRNGMRRAHLLVFRRKGTQLIGVAALKFPTEGHRNSVSGDSNVDVSTVEFELGYIYVHAAHRNEGHAAAMLESLLARMDRPIFATTRSDNLGMQVLLERNRFVRRGQAWPSIENSNKTLQLFLRE